MNGDSQRPRSGIRLPHGGLGPGAALLGCTVERELGRGGMGAVYLAHDGIRGEAVALKVMLDPTKSPAHRERFNRECQALAELDHPGIVRLLRAELVSDRPCMVMEFVSGRNLEAVLEEGDLDLDAKLALLEQVCHAVHHAHERGIVHRDLKPANVLVDPRGVAKVTDFGLVRDLDRRTRLTKTGVMVGTPSYMSPEQVTSAKDVAQTSDVFSLGVMLYEALSGERPFEGESPVQVIAQIVKETPAPVSSLNPELGPKHDAVCARAIAKRAEDRHPTALALAADIARLRARGGGARWLRPLLRLLVGASLAAVVATGVALLSQSSSAPSSKELSARSSELHAAAGELLEGEGLLASEGQQVRALVQELSMLSTSAPPEVSLKIGRAASRVEALSGLFALSEGDLPSARQAADRLDPQARDAAARALRGGIAAVASDGDPALAVKELSGALARGLSRVELRGWRALAQARLGFDSTASAEQALTDLRIVAKARPLTGAEAVIHVRALLGVDRLDDAWAQLGRLADPPLDLRWSVALRFTAEAYTERPAEALARLEALPPQSPPAPGRKDMAARVYRPVGSLLARSRGKSSLPKAEQEHAIAQCWLGKVLWPTEPPPLDVVRGLLRHALGSAESGSGSSVGDPELARDVAALVPADLNIQRRVAALIEFSTDQSDKRALCPAVRRAIQLSQDTAERHKWQGVLCVALGFLNNRYEWVWKQEECEELVAVANRALVDMPRSAQKANVLGARAIGLRRLGELDAAWRDVNAALAIFGSQPQFHYTRMQIARALGKPEEALREAIYYVDLGGENSERTNQCVVEIWEQTRQSGRDDVARPRIEILVRGRPEYAGWWVRAAQLQLAAADVAAARQSMAKAVEWLERPALEVHKELRGDYLVRFRQVRQAVDGRGADAAGEVAALVEALEELRRAWGARNGRRGHLP